MTRRGILQLVFHGLLLIALGMLVGLPFREAIVAGGGAEAERAWRVAHTSLVGGGALYLAIAAVAHHLVLGPRAASFVVGSFLFAAYAFAFVVGPAAGVRGLEPSGGALGVLVFAILVASLLLFFVAVGILLVGAFAALRRAALE